MLDNSQIQVIALGGGGQTAASVVAGAGALDKVNEYIANGATFDPKKEPGSPIAYELRYLVDNSPARVSFTTDYTLRTDRPNPANIIALHRVFITDDDDKDDGDAITETVKYDALVLHVHGHSGGVRYYDNRNDRREDKYSLSRPVSMLECNHMNYGLAMGNNDGWHLFLILFGIADDGQEYELLHTGQIKMANGDPKSRDWQLNC